VEYPVISADPRVQAHYEACRAAGTSHSLAEMFALARPPMSNTDREFLEGYCNGSQFEKTPALGDLYRAEAAAAGVNTQGAVYLGGLAEYPGDPRAWVRGRGDVVKVAEERGLDVRGAVTVRAGRREPQPVGLAEDIVQREVAEIAAASPAPALVDREDLADKVRQKRKPHWAK
jgi:hypothetical protein